MPSRLIQARRPTLEQQAAAAAGDNRVVLSVGSLDGVMLEALRKVHIVATDGAPVSAWGEGVEISTPGGATSVQIHTEVAQADQVQGGTDGTDTPV